MSLFDRPSAPPAHLPPRRGRFLRQIGAGARCWSLTGLKLLLGGDGLGADTSCLLSGSGWVVRWLIRRGYFAPAAGLPARRSSGVDSPCKARLSEPHRNPSKVASCGQRPLQRLDQHIPCPSAPAGVPMDLCCLGPAIIPSRQLQFRPPNRSTSDCRTGPVAPEPKVGGGGRPRRPRAGRRST